MAGCSGNGNSERAESHLIRSWLWMDIPMKKTQKKVNR